MNLYHQLIFGLTGLKYVKITQGETITAGYVNQKGDRIGKWTEREAGEKRWQMVDFYERKVEKRQLFNGA